MEPSPMKGPMEGVGIIRVPDVHGLGWSMIVTSSQNTTVAGELSLQAHNRTFPRSTLKCLSATGSARAVHHLRAGVSKYAGTDRCVRSFQTKT
jgi:hypothetical protein